MVNFRDCYKREEINHWFLNITSQNDEILFWQNKNNHRNLTYFKIENLQNNKITLTSNDGHLFTKDYPIYCYSKYKTLIFKGNLLDVELKKITITYPSKIKLEELRLSERYDMFGFKQANIDIIKANQNQNLNTFKIYDLSKTGASFVIGQNNNDYQIGEELIIKNVLNESYHADLKGKIIHMQPFSIKTGIIDTKLNKIGIKLNRSLPLDRYILFKKFTSKKY